MGGKYKVINDQLDTIKQAQTTYFKKVIATNEDGIEVKNNQYNQILKSEKLGYFVDVYDGPTKPKGKGYVLIEEKIENGKIYRKVTNLSGSEDYRTHDWREVIDVE